MKKYFSLFLGVLTILSLSGCGSSQMPESSTPSTPDSVQGTSQGNTFPTDYPTDIPNYPNATTLFALKDAQPGNYSISQETTDGVSTVISWMDRFFQEAGFQKTSTNIDQQTALLDYDKGSIRLHIQIARNTDQNTTRILTNRLLTSQ